MEIRVKIPLISIFYLFFLV